MGDIKAQRQGLGSPVYRGAVMAGADLSDFFGKPQDAPTANSAPGADLSSLMPGGSEGAPLPPAPTEYGPIQTAAMHAGQGLTFGFSPSVAGAIGAATGNGYTKSRDAYRKALDESGEQHPYIAMGADVAGSILPAIVAPEAVGARMLGSGVSLASKLGRGALYGAEAGALRGAGDAKEISDVPSQALQSGAIGAGAGVVGGALGAGLGRVISPETRTAAKALLDKGVRLTPGQILGGAWQKAENAATSIPFLGPKISAAEYAASQDFNRVTIDNTLKKVGKTLDPDTVIGRPALNEAHDKITGVYQSILKKNPVTVDVDKQLSTFAIQAMKDATQDLPPERAKQFAKIVVDRLMSKNKLPANEFRDTESYLGTQAYRFVKSIDPDAQNYGRALFKVQDELRDALARQHPGVAKKLAASHEAFKDLIIIESAAGRIGADSGVFSGAQLKAAARSQDKSARKTQFARGNARMQDWAQTGQDVLGSKVPDSGTATRAFVGGSLLAGAAAFPGQVGAAMVSPHSYILPALAYGAYTKPGGDVMRTLLTKRPAGAKAVADVARRYTAPVTAGAALGVAGESNGGENSLDAALRAMRQPAGQKRGGRINNDAMRRAAAKRAKK